MCLIFETDPNVNILNNYEFAACEDKGVCLACACRGRVRRIRTGAAAVSLECQRHGRGRLNARLVSRVRLQVVVRFRFASARRNSAAMTIAIYLRRWFQVVELQFLPTDGILNGIDGHQLRSRL